MLVDRGRRTAAERDIDLAMPTDEDVLQVAHHWSVDPTALDPDDVGRGSVILAR